MFRPAIIKRAFVSAVRSISQKMANGGWLPRRVFVLGLENIDTRRTVADRDVSFTLRVTGSIEAYRADTLVSKEPETITWLRGTLDKDSMLLDVGANIGLYSLYAACLPNLTVSCLAFEPAAVNFAQLCGNIFDNGLAGRVQPVSVALSDKSGIVGFEVADLIPGSALHGSIMGNAEGAALRQIGAGITLDDFLRQHPPPARPTHLKIDVDGPELAVLKGAEQTLRSPQLRHLLIELSETTAAEGQALVERAGFSLADQGAAEGGNANFIFKKA
jgi:FkbM family methyltransferase